MVWWAYQPLVTPLPLGDTGSSPAGLGRFCLNFRDVTGYECHLPLSTSRLENVPMRYRLVLAGFLIVMPILVASAFTQDPIVANPTIAKKQALFKAWAAALRQTNDSAKKMTNRKPSQREGWGNKDGRG